MCFFFQWTKTNSKKKRIRKKIKIKWLHPKLVSNKVKKKRSEKQQHRERGKLEALMPMPMPMPMIEHERRIFNKQTKKWLTFLRFYLVYFSYEARFCSSTVNISQIAYVNGAWAGKQDLWKISFSFGSSHSSFGIAFVVVTFFMCLDRISSHRNVPCRIASM